MNGPLFRRIRGRAAGHVITVNPQLVRNIEPTMWGGSEINFSDVHAITSRDPQETVQQLLEGSIRLCKMPLCDRLTPRNYELLCERCRDKLMGVEPLRFPGEGKLGPQLATGAPR